ncbi:MAG: Hsp70 family protein, partial [Bacteroidales bacterium]|nr:Hsp70 family protein [Bacteroidales bacterium]
QNKSIGRFHLDGIPPAPRGIPQVEVTFDIDANGILHVAAKDKATGRSQQIRIEASSGLNQDEIDRMKREAQENAETDKKARESVDKLNAADALIFQTEKQLKEYGDKIPESVKGDLEASLGRLKEAHKSQDLAAIDAAMSDLNEKWQKASTEMYQNAQGGQQQPGQQPEQGPGPQDGKKQDGEVTDVDFEEVK